MPLDGDAKRLEEFFATYACEERKLFEPTIEKLVALGCTALLVDEPFNVEALRQACGQGGAFGYDQLGRAAWAPAARLALARHWLAECGDGERILLLVMTPTANGHFTALRLISLGETPRTINCVVMPETELREVWLHQLVCPLIGPYFNGARITVVEAARHVPPLGHPLRKLGGNIEYALRVEGADEVPRAQTDVARDPRPRLARSVGETLAHASDGLAPVHDLDDPGCVEIVAAVPEAPDVQVLARPHPLRTDARPPRGARMPGAARRARARVLCEIARAAPDSPEPHDTRAISGFAPRETGQPAENLCLLLASLRAAGVPAAALTD